MTLSIALVLMQTVFDPQIAPASLPQQRAELVLRRAEEGQSLAGRYLCEDPRRFRSLQELNERFDKLRALFSIRFGTSWLGEMARDPNGVSQQPIDDLGRRDDCRLRDSFAAGMMEFENSLRAAQSELDPVPYRP